MRRKNILITGATDGIGRETALALGRLGHRIILHGRSTGRLDQALAALRDASASDDHEIVRANLASLDNVMSMARSLKGAGEPLGVLINNAGMYMNERRLTRDGFETTFAVNHLSHFLLTLELLEILKDGQPARIISLSSAAHRRGTLDYRDVNAAGHYNAYGAYAQSKLANVLFTRSLSARLGVDPLLWTILPFEKWRLSWERLDPPIQQIFENRSLPWRGPVDPLLSSPGSSNRVSRPSATGSSRPTATTASAPTS
jgi:NAD(P)-dependent dehydrogenase (short-subunit alcohol dehydrogenase family)